MRELKDKKVFIPGALSGIGRSAAIAMGKLRCRKFFVITSLDILDIKVLFFFKKYCFPIYNLGILTISRFMDKSFKKDV